MRIKEFFKQLVDAIHQLSANSKETQALLTDNQAILKEMVEVLGCVGAMVTSHHTILSSYVGGSELETGVAFNLDGVMIPLGNDYRDKEIRNKEKMVKCLVVEKGEMKTQFTSKDNLTLKEHHFLQKHGYVLDVKDLEG